MSIKTRKMNDLVDPIVVQVDKLGQLLEDNKNDPVDTASVKSILVSELSVLIDKLEQFESEYCDDSCNYKEMKNKITKVIQEFCAMSAPSILRHPDPKVTAVKFLEKLKSALRNLEDLECLELKRQVQHAMFYVQEMGEANEIEALENIKELGENLLNMLEPLQDYGKSLINKSLKEKLALYICQLCSAFAMLMNVIQFQHEIHLPLYSSKSYICERIYECLTRIIDIFEENNPEAEGKAERIDHFVYKMDVALDLMAGLSSKPQDEQILECKKLWIAMEDVFSHAMVIAQVCNPDSFKAITGVCQSIMSEYDNLKEQISSDKPDFMLNSLFINTFTDTLYRLERKVNVSVLSLVLDVFSEPFGSLKKLVKMCGYNLTPDKRNKQDLKDFIEDLDQVTDKVMQVGLYAIACCNDINRVTKIKNHMASLESLEAELVPSIISFYLHPDNEERRVNVKLFTSQWQSDMNKLRSAIDLIIDSSAFCQVVLDDLQERVQGMSDDLDNCQPITQSQVQSIVQKACTLATQITAAVDDIGKDKLDRQTIMMIRELKAAIFEADTASKSLLKDKPTAPQQLRVIKRCELLVNVVRRLQPALIVVMNYSQRATGLFEKSRSHDKSSFNLPSSVHDLPRDEKTLTFIKTPYTVKTHKPIVSIQSKGSMKKSQVGLSCLIPYIEKGRTMRMERTIIMYTTPKTQGHEKNDENKNTEGDKNSNSLMRNSSYVRQHLFSRDTFDSDRDLDLASESWNLTAILEQLSNSTSSFSSGDGHSRSEENSSFTDERVSSYSSSGEGDAPAVVGTPDSIGDIRQINKKIEVLKTN
ncbi:serendipity locus protein alpha [Diachasmimorpha longicaudata]|uniref:serendipity locus protein alpha n=1 Tax=Diachasmimorpha longicaudata TaxID=58733 RepID=UPI0030B899C6